MGWGLHDDQSRKFFIVAGSHAPFSSVRRCLCPRDTPECAFDQSDQLLCRTGDGLVQGVRVVGSSYRLVAFEVGFHHTAFIVLAALETVLVTYVNLQPRDAIAEMTQGSFHFASGPSRQRLVTFNVMVSVDLDLHGSLLPNSISA
jgi:hypothetical protein